MRVVPKIDWLTATRPYNYGYDTAPTNKDTAIRIAYAMYRKSNALSVDGFQILERKEPFYQYHFTNRIGQQISLSENQLQGVRLILAGHTIPVGQADQRRQYEALRNEQWRPSRIDVAVDFIDSDQSIETLWTEHIQAQALKRRNKAQLILSGNGDTINIGSRKSDKYMRIYDKGMEQKTDMDWKRIELEIKYKTAHAVPVIYNNLIRRSVATMNDMIESLPEALRDALTALADGWEGYTRPAPKTKSSKELWLMEQILPALESVAREDPGLYERFVKSLPPVVK